MKLKVNLTEVDYRPLKDYLIDTDQLTLFKFPPIFFIDKDKSVTSTMPLICIKIKHQNFLICYKPKLDIVLLQPF